MRLVPYNPSLKLERPDDSLNSNSIPNEWHFKQIVISVSNSSNGMYRFEIIKFFFRESFDGWYPEKMEYHYSSSSNVNGSLYALIQ